MRGWLLLAGVAGCQVAPPTPLVIGTPQVVIAVQTATTAPVTSTLPTEVLAGEVPWWSAVPAGPYLYEGTSVILARGETKQFSHVSEGLLNAKISAHLAVRKAAEPVMFTREPPEPEPVDLYLTRSGRFLALYRMRLPSDARLQEPPSPLAIPHELAAGRQRRIGRHLYDRGRHLYLECEVEGPLTNPDWGRSRASASLSRSKVRARRTSLQDSR